MNSGFSTFLRTLIVFSAVVIFSSTTYAGLTGSNFAPLDSDMETVVWERLTYYSNPYVEVPEVIESGEPDITYGHGKVWRYSDEYPIGPDGHYYTVEDRGGAGEDGSEWMLQRLIRKEKQGTFEEYIPLIEYLEDERVDSKIDDSFYDELTSLDPDETVEVIIGLSPKIRLHLPREDTKLRPDEPIVSRPDMVKEVQSEIEAIKEELAYEQSAAVDFLEELDVKVTEQFWIINAVVAEIPAWAIDEILSNDLIRSIEKNGRSRECSAGTGVDTYVKMQTNTLLNHNWTGENPSGRNGSSNILIGVLEGSILNTNHVAFNDTCLGSSRIYGIENCLTNPCTTGQPAADEISCPYHKPQHAMHVAGVITADLMEAQDANITDSYQRRRRTGVAREASLYTINSGPNKTTFVRAAEFAASQHLDIVNYSNDFTGDEECPTNGEARGIDSASDAVENAVSGYGVFWVNAAGNSGDSGCTGSSVGSPASAPYALAVGAFDAHDDTPITSFSSTGNVFDYSSRGPTPDGRRKPELLGPGWMTNLLRFDRDLSLLVHNNVYEDVGCSDMIYMDDRINILGFHCYNKDELPEDWEWCNTLPEDWTNYEAYSQHSEEPSGTSFAAPNVAGAAAIFKDWYVTTWGSNGNSIGRLMANLINFGDGRVTTGHSNTYVGGGDDTYGAGRLRMRLLNSTGLGADNGYGTRYDNLSQGETITYTLGNSIPSNVDLLKVVVWWHEPQLNYTGTISTQIRVRLKKAGVIVKTKYSLSEAGNFVKFVFDDESADFYDFGCNGEQWTVEIYGSSVANGGRDVYTAWFYEDLDRTGSGPCQMYDGPCLWDTTDALLWR